jgi:hypothetical protein
MKNPFLKILGFGAVILQALSIARAQTPITVLNSRESSGLSRLLICPSNSKSELAFHRLTGGRNLSGNGNYPRLPPI